MSAKKLSNPFKDLTGRELAIWLCSSAAVTLSFILSGEYYWATLVASLVGVTALIFIAKGYVLGQMLTVVFSLMYGLISLRFHYYGEMITYLGMTMPIAVASVVTWLKNPYGGTKEVKVNHLNISQIVILALATAGITALFYFILKALGTENLLVSTFSVTTSFAASSLMMMRCPAYALAYAANDVVLIVLWTLASISSLAYLPMTVCFAAFLVNDVYGYISWSGMKARQKAQSLIDKADKW